MVDRAATMSGLAWTSATALAIAFGGSNPSSSGGNTFRSGHTSAIVAVKLSATRFSVVLKLPCVTATEPVFPSNSVQIALAASAAYTAGSVPTITTFAGQVPSSTLKCGATTGIPASSIFLMTSS